MEPNKPKKPNKLKKLIALRDHLLLLDSGSGDAAILTWAIDRMAVLERLDRQAATYVEGVICMRTGFTGDPPYVGWKGLGRALNEALDERDRWQELWESRDGD